MSKPSDDHRKAQHHAHATVLRSLGQKWAKILYALWSSGDVYNEAPQGGLGSEFVGL
jgi:hypothetical protein